MKKYYINSCFRVIRFLILKMCILEISKYLEENFIVVDNFCGLGFKFN